MGMKMELTDKELQFLNALLGNHVIDYANANGVDNLYNKTCVALANRGLSCDLLPLRTVPRDPEWHNYGKRQMIYLAQSPAGGECW